MSGIDTISILPPFTAEHRNAWLIAQETEQDYSNSADQVPIRLHGSRPQIAEVPILQGYARLHYDNDGDEVVVEVLNPQTGDVLLTLPLEALSYESLRDFANDRGAHLDISA